MLADLDELILRCRDERARAYIREAVACCKAGAYRSAIVSAWVAVAFDIIDKIQELALAGDKAAGLLVQDFEGIIARHDLPRALAFEKRLLTVAKDDFELISAQEYTDLERLQQDRHRCAHPSHSKFGEVFSPPAELARVHVRAAVEHLLQHEPAQGKAALDRLVKEILSDYFPSKYSDALAYLRNSALKRARPSLVRNLMLILMKTALDPAQQNRKVLNCRRALRCIREMHSAIWSEVVHTELTRLYRNISDPEGLVRAVEFIDLDPVLIAELGADQVARLQEFIKGLPSEHVNVLEDSLNVPQFAEVTRARMIRLTAKEIREATWYMVPDQVYPIIVEKYAAVTSFDFANEWGRTIIETAYGFSDDQVRAILLAAAKNSQIQGSFSLGGVIAAFKKSSRIPDDEFEKLAAAARGSSGSDFTESSDGDFDDNSTF